MYILILDWQFTMSIFIDWHLASVQTMESPLVWILVWSRYKYAKIEQNLPSDVV